MATTPPLPTVLTFAPMIDSETCRFVLSHYGVAFEEQRHIFGWVSVLAYLRGGSKNIPLFTGDGINVVGPKPIVAHYDAKCAADKKLIPAAAADQAQVEKDWMRYNSDLAAETAVLGYSYLLPHKDIMFEPFTRGIPGWEALLVRIGYPALVALFTSLLKLTPERVRDALNKVRAIFDETDKRIADGRQYLVGAKFSLADIALSTAAAPLLLPPFYGSPMPTFDSMPADLKAIMTELRAHPTARFINAIYQNHRRG